MSVVNPIFPTLSIMTIAAMARARGHKVKILDLSMIPYNYNHVRDVIKEEAPDICGITALTPCVNQLIDMSVLIKDVSENIRVVGGGPHPSSLPKETMLQSRLDAVFVGEADYTFADLCDGKGLKDIPGLFYRDGEDIIPTPLPIPIENLDDLPFPAWDLYDPVLYAKYISRLLCRKPPVTAVEFSRGCVFKCDFCASKMTLALGYRKKSPERCAEEIRRIAALGYNEFLVADDIFTSDQKWATEVCEAIIKAGAKINWTCTNGIRVESANEELFAKMAEAGCYRVSFGFESGSDEVLKKFGKGGKASIEKGAEAVRLANAAGLDTNGYFMVGLSCDTEETMEQTIEFARTLPLKMLKFSIAIAFPGTKMFNDYVSKGLIKSYNWDDYHIYTAVSLFSHETLTFKTVQDYMNRAFRRCITLNPAFIFRRIKRGIVTGEFFWDLVYYFRFILMPTTNATKVRYYAQDRWPVLDFDKNKPSARQYQVAKTMATHA